MKGLWLLAAVAVPAVASGAIVVIDQDVHGGHTYLLVGDVVPTASPAGVSWFDAETFAVDYLGGHLATINDLSENEWVFDRFVNDNGHLWLGAFRVDYAFQWVADAENVANYVWPWYPGEPNGQDKLMMLDATWGRALWNDHFGTVDRFSFDGSPIFGLVEVVPEPSSLLACLSVAGILVIRPRRSPWP